MGALEETLAWHEGRAAEAERGEDWLAARVDYPIALDNDQSAAASHRGHRPTPPVRPFLKP
jgi:hypothetical protein